MKRNDYSSSKVEVRRDSRSRFRSTKVPVAEGVLGLQRKIFKKIEKMEAVLLFPKGRVGDKLRMYYI